MSAPASGSGLIFDCEVFTSTLEDIGTGFHVGSDEFARFRRYGTIRSLIGSDSTAVGIPHERLAQSVYLRDYANPKVARRGIGGYFEFHNHRRIHQSLYYQALAEVYSQTAAARQNQTAVIQSTLEKGKGAVLSETRFCLGSGAHITFIA